MGHYPHSLGDSGGALCFYKVIKMSPLENLDVRVITWPALGRNFLFLLLLMANNLLAYPLLKQEAGGTTATKRL